MEFEDVDEQLQSEALRVAATFGVKTFRTSLDGLHMFCKGQSKGITVAWMFERRAKRLTSVSLGKDKARCNVSRVPSGGWHCSPDPLLALGEKMVRGLYCLGIEHTSVIEQLPKLTLQEKAELRLSLPREFWPKKWLDEEEKQ